MTQHILVTGGAGFIGSHLVDALIARGYHVTIIDHAVDLYRQNLNPRAQVINADLMRPETMRLIKRLAPDIIYHCAANASVALSIREPLYDLKTNFLITALLLEVAAQIGVKLFVYTSTGGGLSSEHTVLPTPEHLVSKPLSPYAIHKLSSEQLGEFYRMEKGLQFVALRFANVYGPRQTATCGEANIVASFIHQMLRYEPTVINGNGHQTRDFVYINDVIKACLMALDNPYVSGPLNVGSGTETDVLTIHRMLSLYLGYTQKPTIRPALRGEVLRSCLDVNKIRMLLGWQPETLLAHGIAETVEWHRKQQHAHARDKALQCAV